MRRPVHFEVEIFYETAYRAACNTRAKLTEENTTTYEPHVTCAKCLRALGYEAVPDDQLTVAESDPLRRAA